MLEPRLARGGYCGCCVGIVLPLFDSTVSLPELGRKVYIKNNHGHGAAVVAGTAVGSSTPVAPTAAPCPRVVKLHRSPAGLMPRVTHWKLRPGAFKCEHSLDLKYNLCIVPEILFDAV